MTERAVQAPTGGTPTGGTPTGGTPAPGRAGRAGPGWALLLLGISLFVVGAGVARLVLDSGVGAVELTSVRIAGTAAVLGAVLVLGGRARTLKVTWREVPLLVAYGIGGVGLVQVSIFVAFERMPIGLALLLEYLAPLIVALVARFVLREHVSALLWPALALALVGLALAMQLTGGGEGLDPVGVAAGLVAAASFAAYFLLGERIVRHRDPLSTTFWGFAVPAVPATVLSPWWTTLDEVSGRTVRLPDALGAGTVGLLLLVLWVVVLGTLGPFAAETAALRWIPATTVTVVATLEPVGAAVLAGWWFGEALTALQVLGFALVLSGVTLALYARARGSGPPAPPALG